MSWHLQFHFFCRYQTQGQKEYTQGKLFLTLSFRYFKCTSTCLDHICHQNHHAEASICLALIGRRIALRSYAPHGLEVMVDADPYDKLIRRVRRRDVRVHCDRTLAERICPKGMLIRARDVQQRALGQRILLA
jgi:hypothetical protein